MNSYTGPATVVLDDGTEIQTRAELRTGSDQSF
jgi:hypothetical protein